VDAGLIKAIIEGGSIATIAALFGLMMYLNHKEKLNARELKAESDRLQAEREQKAQENQDTLNNIIGNHLHTFDKTMKGHSKIMERQTDVLEACPVNIKNKKVKK